MSKKPDFPFLLPPGIHKMNLAQLHQIAVAPFQSDAKRNQLFLLLEDWICKLQAVQVTAILWIDGSFLTEKLGPGDIDCMMWNPSCKVPLTTSLERQIEPLIDRISLEARYKIDFYLESPEADQIFHREAYWKGVFGYQHDRVTAKGFVEIAI